MATNSTASSPGYDPGADYIVTVKKTVPHGRRSLSPMHEYTMKGSAVAELPADAIKNVTPRR